MYCFATICVLLLALQVDYSSAACSAQSLHVPRPPSIPPSQESPSPTTALTDTIETVTSIPITRTIENTNSDASGRNRAINPTGDMSESFQSNLASSANDSSHNSNKPLESNLTTSRAGNDDAYMQEVHQFRLEYNKYKILSHLSITGNLDEISYDIDDDVRKKLIATTAFNDNLNSSSSSARHKRSLSCAEVKGDKSACCLESFYVNFTHIGWDKWILYPTGYNANYCRGQCDLSHARYYHSTLLSKYSNLISLCCSPRQMAPLKLLYIDDDNKVHQKLIPDMIVESCDCA